MSKSNLLGFFWYWTYHKNDLALVLGIFLYKDANFYFYFFLNSVIYFQAILEVS